MSDSRHHEAGHHSAEKHEEMHEREPWIERNWGVLVIGFGLICVYFLDTFNPVTY